MVTQPSYTSSPGIVTQQSDNNAQAMLMQAMLQNLKPEQQAPIQAAIALQMRKLANRRYMQDTVRKLAPALTNGAPTQQYQLNTPLTFNLNTALNGYVEGIIVRYTVNYTLAAGASAVYGATAAGRLGFIDNIEIRYNKSQAKFRPQMLRELALLGALDEYMIPEGVLLGQQDSVLQPYLNSGFPLAVGAQTLTQEFFVPLNMIKPDDPRGMLPLMAGDTGIQVIVTTPLALLAPGAAGTGDAVIHSIYPVSGTGHAMTAISGTVQIEAVYRDGDCYYQTQKLPFDISLLDGTFQMQIDQTLSPLVANNIQRTKINVMGKHYYVLLLVVDGNSPASYCAQTNITYIESAKDGIGGNTFWRYGTQTNMSYNEFLFLNRLGGSQDLDPGCIPMIAAPVQSEGRASERLREGVNYLDNTRTGWADWRYGVQVASVGTNSPIGPRIEPHVFYINPTGLVPV